MMGTPHQTHHNSPTPKGSITLETTATTFHPIEKTPCISPRAQSTQVSHTQALNVLQGSQGTSEPIIRRPTPVKTIERPMDNSESSAEHTQNQPVTPVSLHPLHKIGQTLQSLHL